MCVFCAGDALLTQHAQGVPADHLCGTVPRQMGEETKTDTLREVACNQQVRSLKLGLEIRVGDALSPIMLFFSVANVV